jgi:molybdenum cofactor sulfurtransferase
VACLTGWLLEQMRALRHTSGRPLVRFYGPTSTERRGGTIAFNYYDCDGQPHDSRRIEALAAEANISLRTGCFCNPGAGEIAHNITKAEMAECFKSDEPISFDQFTALIRSIGEGKSASTVRISVGLASNFADVHRMVTFARGFLDQTSAAIGNAAQACTKLTRDTG